MPQENGLLEMEGSVENIVYHNDSNQYTVLEVDCGEELITVVGTFPYVSVGERLHLYGTWTSHATFGQQFRAQAFERSRPADTAAMLKYLSSGAVKGIGGALAGRIIEAFGDESIKVIEEDPARLATVKGITLKKAKEISEEMQRVNGIRDLMAFLGSFGVRPEDTVKVWKVYGQDSVACIQEDPYRLCSDKIGISFAVADQLAESLEYDRDNKERVKAGVLYVLRHNLNNGHTCLPADKLCAAAAKLLGVPPESAQEALLELCQTFEAVNENFNGRDFVFLPKQHRSEVYCADRIHMMLRYPPESITGIDREIAEIERTEGIEYAELQKDAIRAALEKGLLILTGGPGTGKTTTLNAIIRILMEKGETVFLAAPTGRAAKRMSELTGVEAKTIHRMLQVDWDDNDDPVFQRNERNPLECDAVVIDELSMVDAYVFESVLRALPIGCRLILVGDSDQLPSVGPGNVIGDLIASKVFPTVQLKEIFRQSMESLIVMNAHKIVEGEMPELSVRSNDFFFMPREDAHSVSETVQSLVVTRLPKSYGYSPVTDIQVLCPGRKGELGTVELNRKLREQINPPAKNKPQVTVNGTVFRVGDKVMQIKNDYNLPWSREDGTVGEGVYNGDMGIIIDVDKDAGCLRVEIDDKEVLYDFEHAAAELELAYAVTVHKSQGNEFTAVVMPMFPGAPQLSYRNLQSLVVTRLPKSYGYSPVTDIQVLCPGRKGELGTVELNRKLREQINPPAKNKPQVTVNGTVFRVGDKVMQIKNDYNLPWSREDGTVGEGVYNGDMGIIIDVDKDAGCLRVEIDDKEVLYDFEHAAAELELAYAVTVHKSQGNEFTAVVMPMFPGAPQLSYRNLLYTGITRAKKLLILVGKRSVVADMVANDKKTRRFSGLQHFLLEKPEEDGPEQNEEAEA